MCCTLKTQCWPTELLKQKKEEARRPRSIRININITGNRQKCERCGDDSRVDAEYRKNNTKVACENKSITFPFSRQKICLVGRKKKKEAKKKNGKKGGIQYQSHVIGSVIVTIDICIHYKDDIQHFCFVVQPYDPYGENKDELPNDLCGMSLLLVSQSIITSHWH